MKTYKVKFRPLAESDLFRLYQYIAEISGHRVAGDFIGPLETACLQLQTFPERGALRNDLQPGLRMLGFERRAVILFKVGDKEVLIIRVLYGGRDMEHILANQRFD